MKKITIHCSDTPNGHNYTVDDINIWHIARGFKKVGYHYVIHIDGSLNIGRLENEMGAHVRGLNRDNIGICLIGRDKFNEKQTATLVALLAHMTTIDPGATIHGHYEFSKKTCPNFNVKEFCKEYNL
jgi:N-acetylmuramoyl-L-alanine amidase